MKLNKRFQLRLSSKTSSKATIRCFVSVNAEKEIPFSTNCRISPEQWSQEAQRIVGNLTDEQKAINETLAIIDADVRELFNEFKARKEPFTTRMLVDAYTKPSVKSPTFLEIWQLYLDNEQLRIHDFQEDTICRTTFEKYEYARNKFVEFMKFKKISMGVMCFEITKHVLSDYYDFLCSKKNFRGEPIDPHEAFRYIKKLNKVIEFALKKDYIRFAPVPNLGIKVPPARYKEIVFLTDAELLQIYTAEALSETERGIVDGFIFMSFSSMTYSDFQRFANSPTDCIKTDEDGYEYISQSRYKNRKLQNQPEQHIPLIKILKAILERYNYRIPVFANQTYNKSIKLIAHRIGIARAEKITTYVGRKSAATFYINQDGVDIKTVAKILGHKHELTTRNHYAVTQDETVKRQIGRLEL